MSFVLFQLLAFRMKIPDKIQKPVVSTLLVISVMLVAAMLELVNHCPQDANQINGFVQERHNSIANTLELRLSCTSNPWKWCFMNFG